jgi:hypothetical protein
MKVGVEDYLLQLIATILLDTNLLGLQLGHSGLLIIKQFSWKIIKKSKSKQETFCILEEKYN